MAYSISTPVFLTVTGLLATGTFVPADFGTFTMPISGSHYVPFTQTYYVAVGTGFGSNAGGFNFFTQTGGLGTKLYASDAQGGGSVLTTANASTTSFTANSAASGSFTSPTITVRQITAADTTGILGVKVGFLSLP